MELCRSLGVLAPEDSYPVWDGAGGPVTVAPFFLLNDYSFRPTATSGKAEGPARAYASGVVCSDEWLLRPDPHQSREDWCQARIELTEWRLEARDPALPVVLVNHFPLVREPTRVLRVRFVEMSLGYPRAWRARGRGPGQPRQILPASGNPG